MPPFSGHFCYADAWEPRRAVALRRCIFRGRPFSRRSAHYIYRRFLLFCAKLSPVQNKNQPPPERRPTGGHTARGAGFVVIYDTVGRYTPPERAAVLPFWSIPRTDKNRPLPLKSAVGGDLYYRRISKRTLPIRSGSFTQFRTVQDAGASGRGIRPVHPQSYLRGLLMAAYLLGRHHRYVPKSAYCLHPQVSY